MIFARSELGNALAKPATKSVILITETSISIAGWITAARAPSASFATKERIFVGPTRAPDGTAPCGRRLNPAITSKKESPHPAKSIEG